MEVVLQNYNNLNTTVELIHEIVRKKPLRECLSNIKNKECEDVVQELNNITGKYPIYSDEMFTLSKLLLIKNVSSIVDEDEAKDLKYKLNNLVTLLEKEIS